MKVNNLAALSDMAVFVAVAETGGFSAAARRLLASKAMVSVAVSRLEGELGVKLFQRTTRRLSLTEAGASMLPHAQRSLSAARDAEEAATQAQTLPRGLLRVNAPMSFGLKHVVPALGDFARAHAEIRVELVLDDRLLDLVEGGFDLALRIGALSDSGLVAQRLGTSHNVLVAHPEYVERAGRPTTPSALKEHATLLYSLSSTASRWVLTRGSKTESVAVSPLLRANSSLALLEAAKQGLGIASVPRFLVGEELADGTLIQLLPDWELPQHGVFALTTARDHVPRKTRAFIDFFRARIGTPPYWERGVAKKPRYRLPSRSSRRA